MSSPIDPEDLLKQMVPQLSQQLVDRLLGVCSYYLSAFT